MLSPLRNPPGQRQVAPAVERLAVGIRKRAHDVADRIEQLIAAGEFGASPQLPSEKALSQRFGVGRPAVREALFILQQAGLVEVSNGSRARITTPDARFLVTQLAAMTRRLAATPQGQEQVEQARWVFESGMAWQAAQLATPEDIARLKAALERNVGALGNVAEFVRTDIAFHYEIALIPRNSIFAAVHEVVVEWLVDQRTTTINLPDADRLSVRDHTAIFEAIAAHDPGRAFHEMSSHLRLVSQLYREARRFSDQVLRDLTHTVASRIAREQAELWAASFGARRAPAPQAKPARPRARTKSAAP
jgi:GntR family transcriptional regulator, sialic acid-inducible nan operon repressor